MARVEKEVETVVVTLRRRQVERSPPVVVRGGHVDPLEEHPVQGRHVPRHSREQEGDDAHPGVLQAVPAGVDLVRLPQDGVDLIKLVEVED